MAIVTTSHRQRVLLAASLAASLVALSACYSPRLQDCAVACSGADDCAGGQVCGSDGLCAAPGVAGRCESLGQSDASSGTIDARPAIDADPNAPDADPSAPDARPAPDAAPGLVTLTVDVNGPGSVTSSPGGIDCPSTCTAQFPAGQSITLSASQNVGAMFSGWGATCDTDGDCQLTLTEDKTVTASFALQTFNLRVEVYGKGKVVSAAHGIDCESNPNQTEVCNHTIDYGTVVPLTAMQVNPAHQFSGWTTPNCSDQDDTCNVTVTGETTVRATFGVGAAVAVPPEPRSVQ